MRVTGYDVDKVQRDWMKDSGSLHVMWGTSHPVGYWAHDAGPSLSGGTIIALNLLVHGV